MKAYNVYLNGKWINRVFWEDNSNQDEVKKSLIEHDGYNPNITVRQKHYQSTRKGK